MSIFTKKGLLLDNKLNDVENKEQAVNNILASYADGNTAALSLTDLAPLRGISLTNFRANQTFKRIGQKPAFTNQGDGSAFSFETFQNKIDAASAYIKDPAYFGGNGLTGRFYTMEAIAGSALETLLEDSPSSELDLFNSPPFTTDSLKAIQPTIQKDDLWLNGDIDFPHKTSMLEGTANIRVGLFTGFVRFSDDAFDENEIFNSIIFNSAVTADDPKPDEHTNVLTRIIIEDISSGDRLMNITYDPLYDSPDPRLSSPVYTVLAGKEFEPFKLYKIAIAFFITDDIISEINETKKVRMKWKLGTEDTLTPLFRNYFYTEDYIEENSPELGDSNVRAKEKVALVKQGSALGLDISQRSLYPTDVTTENDFSQQIGAPGAYNDITIDNALTFTYAPKSGGYNAIEILALATADYELNADHLKVLSDANISNIKPGHFIDVDLGTGVGAGTITVADATNSTYNGTYTYDTQTNSWRYGGSNAFSILSDGRWNFTYNNSGNNVQSTNANVSFDSADWGSTFIATQNGGAGWTFTLSSDFSEGLNTNNPIYVKSVSQRRKIIFFTESLNTIPSTLPELRFIDHLGLVTPGYFTDSGVDSPPRLQFSKKFPNTPDIKPGDFVYLNDTNYAESTDVKYIRVKYTDPLTLEKIAPNNTSSEIVSLSTSPTLGYLYKKSALDDLVLDKYCTLDDSPSYRAPLIKLTVVNEVTSGATTIVVDGNVVNFRGEKVEASSLNGLNIVFDGLPTHAVIPENTTITAEPTLDTPSDDNLIITLSNALGARLPAGSFLTVGPNATTVNNKWRCFPPSDPTPPFKAKGDNISTITSIGRNVVDFTTGLNGDDVTLEFNGLGLNDQDSPPSSVSSHSGSTANYTHTLKVLTNLTDGDGNVSEVPFLIPLTTS
jgi:hypothetical protein